MYRQNKPIFCIQIVIIVFFALCNDALITVGNEKTKAYPCEDHQCGCSSLNDCMTNCCCAVNDSYQTEEKKPHHPFQAFIKSIHCKSGSDKFACIQISMKYLPGIQLRQMQEQFLCFLAFPTSIYPSTLFASPPEKPPRHFALNPLIS